MVAKLAYRFGRRRESCCIADDLLLIVVEMLAVDYDYES
jgi:hypothetical protein